MTDFVFISGNQPKVNYLVKWLGRPVDHQKIELDEIQSLDLRTVVEDKARRAYAIVQRPVLVEDVALTFKAFGQLPGTFIKWFLEEVGTEGLCRMMGPFDDKRAVASIMYGLFDGQELHTFEAHMEGTVPDEPRSLEEREREWGSNRSWNSVFIPAGSQKTYAQTTDEEIQRFSHRAVAVAKLRSYLAG